MYDTMYDIKYDIYFRVTCADKVSDNSKAGSKSFTLGLFLVEPLPLCTRASAIVYDILSILLSLPL